MTAVALCAAGMEKILSNEIKKLASQSGAKLAVQSTSFGRVYFNADISALYYALFGLRTADRILLQCAQFSASNFDELFEGIRSVETETFLGNVRSLRIGKVRSHQSVLAAETSIQSVAHKALAERLCSVWNISRLPEEKDAANFRIYIEKNIVQLLLDISGDALYKRGYRIEGGIAPLRETVAAAMILASGWKRKYPLYDPFCGSGTIIIEAALYAYSIAPSLARRFALDDLPLANLEARKTAYDYFIQCIDFSRTVRISGSDADNAMVILAKKNLNRAFNLLAKDAVNALVSEPPIHISVLPMQEAHSYEEDGFVICNPPYGGRLQDIEFAEKNYGEMAILQKKFPGWRLLIISDHAGFESFFGTKAVHCRKLFAGAKELYFYEFNGAVLPAKKNIQPSGKPSYPHKNRSSHKYNNEQPQQEKRDQNTERQRRPNERPPAKWTW